MRLHREIAQLKSELVPVFQRDKERVEAEGRPFDAAAWWGGELDDGKYPGGPAFYVRWAEGKGAGAAAGVRARASVLPPLFSVHPTHAHNPLNAPTPRPAPPLKTPGCSPLGTSPPW